jgi:acyl-CoA synthetase (AMP-forming)/AMP-acid ligase II
MTLAGLAARNARLYPDKPAFVMGGRAVTFAEHDDRARRLVAGLAARGVGPGARVAILARNTPAYLDVYAAAETISSAARCASRSTDPDPPAGSPSRRCSTQTPRRRWPRPATTSAT